MKERAMVPFKYTIVQLWKEFEELIKFLYNVRAVRAVQTKRAPSFLLIPLKYLMCEVSTSILLEQFRPKWAPLLLVYPYV